MIKKTLFNIEFLLALLIVLIATVSLFIFHPGDVVTINPLYHWFSWIGASYIAVAIPLFSILKRRYQKKYQMITRGHIFGNLVAFELICIHIAYQIGSPPVLGTFTHLGLTLYIALLILIITGFILRFQLMRKSVRTVRFLHVSLMSTFYLVIVIHVLHGLDVI